MPIMPPGSPDPLADLRARFVSRTRERLVALREAIAAEPPALVAIGELAHQLAGSAGMFGYAALGRAAAALDVLVRQAGGAAAPGRAALGAQLAGIEAQFAALQGAEAAAPGVGRG
jgi:HPt (histidine-containing phosphotransfer) domain-containing protein